MSRASNQSKVLISFINSVFITIEDYKLTPELEHTVLYGKELALKCIDTFPESGKFHKNTRWMVEKIHEIDEILNKYSKNATYSAILLVSIAEQVCTDLMEKIKDKNKLQLLEPLHEAINGLSDQIDPLGIHFLDYEKAAEEISLIYKVVGFTK